ncbi:uncharacterized protein LOC124355057 [Homalodisca vitripennis]|uniref:uncharacterized protein LOC124355057 n=1 Tax=Homalodisca vitripennis TaxID=197043 RepID=UPI001EEBD22A|nr:uncharacterized protein LOC124355057 [Homalodisca vitripennis]
MARHLCIVFAAIFITGVLGADLKYLHVKYALWDGFYSLPLTIHEIQEDNPPKFVRMSHDEQLNVDLYSYPNDPRVSLLFDTYGNIAGLRTSYIKEDVGKRAASFNMSFNYSYDNKPMYTSGNYWGKDLWYTSVLFVNPDKLKAGGRSETGGLVAEDIYLKVDGTWTRISKEECNVEAQGFTKQACFVGMGMHYFYKVTPTSECADFQGTFLLYEQGKLIGLGFNPFGAFTSKDRVWFEDVPPKVVKDIVPNGPECMTDWVTHYGATSFHIFFKRFPRVTICSWPWQKGDRCNKQ